MIGNLPAPAGPKAATIADGNRIVIVKGRMILRFPAIPPNRKRLARAMGPCAKMSAHRVACCFRMRKRPSKCGYGIVPVDTSVAPVSGLAEGVEPAGGQRSGHSRQAVAGRHMALLPTPKGMVRCRRRNPAKASASPGLASIAACRPAISGLMPDGEDHRKKAETAGKTRGLDEHKDVAS
jgi:hypothetical protein